MPRRHALARKKITVLHTLKERKRLRHHQRKLGPAAVRRADRRIPLQPKPGTVAPVLIPVLTPFEIEQAKIDKTIAPWVGTGPTSPSVIEDVVAMIETLHANRRCDGNHGGPRCTDPGCWNDEAAQ